MNPIEKLNELFIKFPGIGPKQARRFVYFLMRENDFYKKELIDAINFLKESSKTCELCFRFFSDKNNNTNICSICSDENRDSSQLIIIEKELDFDAIEKTNSYNGLYFILGGLLPPFCEKPSEKIRIKELIDKVYKSLTSETLKEIILALPVNNEGDDTKDYIEKTLSQIVGIKKIKISNLARGLSTGLEIEYVDKNTFKYAFEKRQ